MSFNLQITGIEQLERRLRNLERRGARRALTKASRAGLKPLLAAVRAEVPRDEGLLKKTISSKVKAKGGRVTAMVGSDVAKLKALASAERRPSNIDHLLEYGHKAADGSVVPPAGYIRRAVDKSRAAVESAFIARLKTEIEAEATR